MSRVPRIRFKGFEEDWEQRKLGEVVVIERGGSPRPIEKYITESNDGLNWIKIGDAPIQGRYITKTSEKIKKSGLSKTRQVFPGDLILSNSMSFGKPYIMGIEGCIHDGWLVIKNKNNVFDLKFLCHMLSTEYLFNQYKMFAAGSTVNNLNKELVGNASVRFPKMLEQRKIVKHLESLDHLITLHQRKLEKLKIIKKSMLENLFTQNGEKTPKIRFSGFTEDWEQRKLGEFGKATGGISIESEFDEHGKYKVISIGSYSEESKYTDQGIRVYKTKKTESRILNKNDLVMILNDKTSSGNIIGRVLLVDKYNTYVYNQRTERIEINKSKFLPEYLYQLLNSDNIREKIICASQGNTQIYVNWTIIREFTYKITTDIEEQGKIARFFISLDHLITLHQLEPFQLIFKAIAYRIIDYTKSKPPSHRK